MSVKEIYATMKRDKSSRISGEDTKKIRQLSASIDEETSTKIKIDTPIVVTQGTIASALYGCSYPQGKDNNEDSLCVPECINGVRLEGTHHCSVPVYERSSFGKLKKINDVKGDHARVYPSSNRSDKYSQLSEEEKSILSEDGVRSVTLYQRNGTTIQYDVSQKDLSINVPAYKNITVESQDMSEVEYQTQSDDRDVIKSKTEECDKSEPDWKTISYEDDDDDDDIICEDGLCSLRKKREGGQNGSLIIVAVIVFVVLIFIAAIMGYYYYGGGTNEVYHPTTTTTTTQTCAPEVKSISSYSDIDSTNSLDSSLVSWS